MNDRSKEQHSLPGLPDAGTPILVEAAAIVADAPIAIPSVGERLRVAREVRKLSLDDVSQAIKIAPRVLEQIEGNAWAQLPGYTFARGVVRSYARLVRLDPEVLLRDLEGEPMPKLPLLELRPSTQTALPVPGDANKRDRVAMLAGVMLVAVAVVAYFLIPDDWLGTHSPVKGRMSVTTEPIAAVPAPAASAGTPMLQTPAGTIDPAASSSASPVPAEPLGGSSIAAATSGASPATSPSAGGVPVATNPVTLVLRFEEGSWAEVRDRAGVMLISENVAPRSERQLAGEPPYNIWLGNADGVRMSFRGQPVDLKPHTRQKVARLVLE